MRGAVGQWFVTNGRKTVGPVATNLLLRAVAEEHVDPKVMAWREPWPDWRALETTREVQALRKTQSMLGRGWIPPRWWEPDAATPLTRPLVARWMEDASDEQELLSMAMQALALEMRASIGMLHRPDGALGALTTRSLFGNRQMEQLGDVVRPGDPAMRVARLGVAVLGDPSESRAGIASVTRLGESCEGVALAPIYKGPRLAAVIELGKDAVPFRESDRALIKSYTRLVSERLRM
ncbi:MAG: GYF domain-containing protein [Polyangiaceae bacterium]